MNFYAAPQTDLNRVYRLDRVTGEIGACQYGLKEASVGITLCFGSGEGAGPQAPSEYSLVASRHEREGGIYRIDMRTGMMSICYVLDTTPSFARRRRGRPRAKEEVGTKLSRSC